MCACSRNSNCRNKDKCRDYQEVDVDWSIRSLCACELGGVRRPSLTGTRHSRPDPAASLTSPVAAIKQDSTGQLGVLEEELTVRSGSGGEEEEQRRDVLRDDDGAGIPTTSEPRRGPDPHRTKPRRRSAVVGRGSTVGEEGEGRCRSGGGGEAACGKVEGCCQCGREGRCRPGEEAAASEVVRGAASVVLGRRL
nr:unnamed protein product [Digitaria exilis]